MKKKGEDKQRIEFGKAISHSTLATYWILYFVFSISLHDLTKLRWRPGNEAKILQNISDLLSLHLLP